VLVTVERLLMLAHIRANLWLLALTLLLCSVLYPLALWGVGQAAFRDHANGSLVCENDLPVGSRLIAHEVKGGEYFQPRPSATGGSAWNATASGASNWAANNYALRDRVARALAPLVKYAKGGPNQGQLVAPDVVKWFRTERPQLVAEWAGAHNGLAQAWVKSDDVTKQYVLDWFKAHPADRREWQRKNPGKNNPQAEDLAGAFFESFARDHPATWLTITESTTEKDDQGAPIKRVALVGKNDEDNADIASVFFDLWRDAHPNVELEDVPADMVMASASGLDPHITLKNALYQLPRVADKWAERTRQDPAKLHGEIEALLRQHAGAPMFGWAGVELINVLDVNLALRQRYDGKK
jgi:K+-transporting ATPase ATPase C chain